MTAQGVTVQDVLNAAKELYAGSKDNLEHARDTVTAGLAGLGVLAALAAFFGYKEFSHVTRPLQARLAELEKKYTARHDDLAKQIDSKLENKLSTDINALLELVFAMSIIDAAEREEGAPAEDTGAAARRKESLERALSHLKDALECCRPSEPRLLAWIQSYQAYACKRLGRLEEALAFIQGAVDVDRTANAPQAVRLYNAACYASLCQQPGKADEFLRQALSLRPDFRGDAEDEKDLEGWRRWRSDRKVPSPTRTLSKVERLLRWGRSEPASKEHRG